MVKGTVLNVCLWLVVQNVAWPQEVEEDSPVGSLGNHNDGAPEARYGGHVKLRETKHDSTEIDKDADFDWLKDLAGEAKDIGERLILLSEKIAGPPSSVSSRNNPVIEPEAQTVIIDKPGTNSSGPPAIENAPASETEVVPIHPLENAPADTENLEAETESEGIPSKIDKAIEQSGTDLEHLVEEPMFLKSGSGVPAPEAPDTEPETATQAALKPVPEAIPEGAPETAPEVAPELASHLAQEHRKSGSGKKGKRQPLLIPSAPDIVNPPVTHSTVTEPPTQEVNLNTW